jgi:hypothetical protein
VYVIEVATPAALFEPSFLELAAAFLPKLSTVYFGDPLDFSEPTVEHTQ